MTAVDLGLPGVRAVSRATGDPTRPDTPQLIDRFGRVATDLRVSLTDRCNLRCTYCMPAEGLDWLPGQQVMTNAELLRLLTVAVTRLGITDIRFTGGEPLLRKGLDEVIAGAAALSPRPRMAMTTNSPAVSRACGRPGWTGSTSRWTPWIPRGSSRSPAGTGSPTCWTGSRARRRPGSPRSR